VAEGVETREQLAFLRTRGCDSYQGFLYCRPLPADEIEALLTRQRKTAAPARRQVTPARRKRKRTKA
jgi:EAL domain-containing protein (putative c-di-GMP-specific phosphodiesterase class I)